MNETLKKFSTTQFLYFCLGFFGLQFAWQMRIILSGPVTEGLGASPFIYGLIWLAGPFTGMVVQPIVGRLSDKTISPFGRRRPYLLGGAILASLALWLFPNSAGIANFLHNLTGLNLPSWSALLVAAIMIWVIDACVNVAQGPYRALIPDVVPQEQHSVANSYISLAIGLGSVVAAGTAPFLKCIFNYQMSIEAQFIMAAIAFTLGMTWTCITIKEKKQEKQEIKENIKKESFIDSVKEFFALSPEVSKICLMQFFTWIGTMCMMIFFTQYSVHTIFGVPDIAVAGADFKNATLEGTNFSSICFAIFNLICFLVAIPIGIFSAKMGNKKVHIFSIITMILAYLVMAFSHNKIIVAMMMGVSGIGWASICALPFAMLSRYIKPGTEGSVMGIFNIFIAGPQVVVCTVVAWIINHNSIVKAAGTFYHWEYSFIIGAMMLALAALTTLTIKDN
ncbi:MFS transporter [bacterium]|nr:MFS transporter [bacterium]